MLPNSTQTEAAANETKAVSEEHYYNSPADYAPTQEPKEEERRRKEGERKGTES